LAAAVPMRAACGAKGVRGKLHGARERARVPGRQEGRKGNEAGGKREDRRRGAQ